MTLSVPFSYYKISRVRCDNHLNVFDLLSSYCGSEFIVSWDSITYTTNQSSSLRREQKVIKLVSYSVHKSSEVHICSLVHRCWSIC
jgi:hypothetical protein